MTNHYPIQPQNIINFIGGNLQEYSLPEIDVLIEEVTQDIETILVSQGFDTISTPNSLDYFQSRLFGAIARTKLIGKVLLNRSMEIAPDLIKPLMRVKEFSSKAMSMLRNEELLCAYYTGCSDNLIYPLPLEEDDKVYVPFDVNYIKKFISGIITISNTSQPSTIDITDLIESETAIVYTIAAMQGYPLPYEGFDSLTIKAQKFYSQAVRKRVTAILVIGQQIARGNQPLDSASQVYIEEAIKLTEKLASNDGELYNLFV